MSRAKTNTTAFDNSIALGEGWDLVVTYDQKSGKTLLEVANRGSFRNGHEATRFVMSQATKGSKYHTDAIKRVMAFQARRSR